MSTLSDARDLLVPPPGDRHGLLSPALLLMTVVTGLVDSFSYLVLGHVFVANMTGNVVFLAFALAGAKGFSLGASLLALAAFALGAVVSGRSVVHLTRRRGRMLALAAAVEAVLVLASVIVGWSVVAPGSGAARYVLVALLGVASGLQTGTARKLAVPDLTTSVLTQTITATAHESRLAGGSSSRLGRRGLSVAAMFSGALVGALMILHLAKPLGLVLALVLLVAVAVTVGTLARTRPVWDEPD